MRTAFSSWKILLKIFREKDSFPLCYIMLEFLFLFFFNVNTSKYISIHGVQRPLIYSKDIIVGYYYLLKTIARQMKK